MAFIETISDNNDNDCQHNNNNSGIYGCNNFNDKTFMLLLIQKNITCLTANRIKQVLLFIIKYEYEQVAMGGSYNDNFWKNTLFFAPILEIIL